MKYLFFVLMTAAIAAFPAFAQFECNAGLYGGFGTAGSAGINVQAGYDFMLKDDTLRLALLADLGIGYRYGNDEVSSRKEIWGGSFNYLDYYFGALCEFYFLPFMGIGAGGGWTVCVCGNKNGITPYARVTLPFVMKYFKAGVGFDYIFRVEESHKNVPMGYRVNFLFNVRIMEFSGR